MAKFEDHHSTREKHLPNHLLMAGLLAFCLILSVATTHLDAQPRGRNQAGSQPIDSRRLKQILTKIEQRLTALEKQRVSHQPSAPSANQASSSPDLTAIEARLAALENQAGSPQSTAPATNQTASPMGELTCTKLTVVNSQGIPVIEVGDNLDVPGGQIRIKGPDGTMRIRLATWPNGGGGMLEVQNGGAQGGAVFVEVVEDGGRIMIHDNNGVGSEPARRSHTH